MCKGGANAHPCWEIDTPERNKNDGADTKESSSDEGQHDQEVVSHDRDDSSQMEQRIDRNQMHTRMERAMRAAAQLDALQHLTLQGDANEDREERAERKGVTGAEHAEHEDEEKADAKGGELLLSIKARGLEALKSMHGHSDDGGGGGGDGGDGDGGDVGDAGGNQATEGGEFLAVQSRTGVGVRARVGGDDGGGGGGGQVTELDRAAESTVWRAESAARTEIENAEDGIVISLTQAVHEADTNLHAKTTQAEAALDAKSDEAAQRFDAREAAADARQQRHADTLAAAINEAVLRVQQALWQANRVSVAREAAANAQSAQTRHATLKAARGVTKAQRDVSAYARSAAAAAAAQRVLWA